MENGEEEEFKKSFLESLLEQVQGEGNGFDADKLDGLHLQDIKDYMESQYGNRLKAFQVGQVSISNNNIDDHNGYLTLGFDGVTLYPLKADGTPQEGYPTLLPWDTGYTSPEWSEEPPNVLTAFEELYGIVQDKVDQTEFDEVKESVTKTDTLIEAMEDNKNIIYNNNVFAGLNADSINGIRIYIMTQAQYDEKARTNPEVINDLHNLFIIKSNETVIDDLLKAHEPNTAPINSYYEFRVSAEDPAYPNDPTHYMTEKWLQYKHADLARWHKMCPVSDFTDADTIKNAVFEVIQTSSNYTINPTAFASALKGFQIEDSESDYPLANYIRNYTARSAYSHQFKLNPTDQDILPLVNGSGSSQINNGQPRYINLDNFGQAVINKSGINDVKTTVGTIQTTVNGLTNPSNGTIKTIQTDITSNATDIADLRTKYNSLKTSLTQITGTVEKLFTYEKAIKEGSAVNTGNWVTTGNEQSRVYFFRYGYTVFVYGSLIANTKIKKGTQRHICTFPQSMYPGTTFREPWISLKAPEVYGNVYSVIENGVASLKIKPYNADLIKGKNLKFSGAYLLKDFIQEKDAASLNDIIAGLNEGETNSDDN